MARPAEFVREEALEAALKLFWSQGYGATSLQQLLTAMDLSRSSFYAAFGEKRSLYAEILSLFADRTLGILERRVAEGRGPEAIGLFFYDTLLSVPRRRAARGCLMVNTVLELAEVDPGLCELAEAELARVEHLFATCLAPTRRGRKYTQGHSPASLAAHVMLLNQGLRVASRKGLPRRALKEQIDTALALAGLQVPTSSSSKRSPS